jgi:hypothetical protein
MNVEQLKENGIRILSLVPIALLAAALTCPATDIEPPWGDAAPPDGAPGDPDDDPDGDEPFVEDEPPADAADALPPGPPALVPLRCLSPEIAAGSVCLVVGAHSTAVRWRMDRPAVGRVDCTGPGVAASASGAAPTLEPRLVLAPLVPGRMLDCTVSGANDSGELALAAFGLETAGDAPWVAITEVLENPLGEEPTQEFVELANLDDASVDVGGWTLADESGGAPLPDGTVLEPGDVALLVADDYAPDGDGDPAADPLALLVRVGRAIGTQGLRNTGEGVALFDATGALVTGYPNVRGALPDGVSAVRVPPESPEADEGAWAESGDGGPTPGRLER